MVWNKSIEIGILPFTANWLIDIIKLIVKIINFHIIVLTVFFIYYSFTYKINFYKVKELEIYVWPDF